MTKKNNKLKEGIDFEFQSKEVHMWNKVVNQLQMGIDQAKKQLGVDEIFLKTAKKELAKAKRKEGKS